MMSYHVAAKQLLKDLEQVALIECLHDDADGLSGGSLRTAIALAEQQAM